MSRVTRNINGAISVDGKKIDMLKLGDYLINNNLGKPSLASDTVILDFFRTERVKKHFRYCLR